MSTIVCAGRYANHLERIPSGNVTVSDEDSIYTKANLVGDLANQSWRPFRHASPAAADRNVTIDKTPVINGGGETADMTGWTEENVGASNDVTNVSSPVNSGARAFQMTIVTTGGGNKASIVQEKPVRASERGTFTVALRGDGTRIARARFYLVELGLYLQAAGTWTATPTDFATRTLATYATTSVATTAPAYSAQVPSGEYTLRLISYVDGASAGSGFVDDFYFWPATDLFALIGHDVMPAITALELRRDTAAFAGAGTLEATLTVKTPTLYNLPAAIRDDRYWRLRAVGTNSEALWYGSLWLGQKLTLTQVPVYDIEEELLSEQIRGEVGGVERVHLQEDIPRRRKGIPWEYINDAAYQQNRDQVWRSGGFGQYPMLYIESDADPEAAMLIRLPGRLPMLLESPVMRQVEAIPVTEQAFPTFVG
jgi:hypothetical protein